MAGRITVKGQITIPKAARDAAGIGPGDRLIASAEGPGVIRFVKAPTSATTEWLDQALEEIERRGLRTTMTAEDVMSLTRD